jgi:hypothetical protein
MTDQNGAGRGRLKRAVQGAAPQLARALGGPLAGAAAEALSRAIFGKPEASEQAIVEALKTASPELLVELRRADLDFARAIEEARVAEARVAAADRADARAREIARRDWTPTLMGSAIIVGFFVVLWGMVTHTLPEGGQTEFSIMLGALAAMTAGVVNYFFGSSVGSREKTRLMSDRALFHEEE